MSWWQTIVRSVCVAALLSSCGQSVVQTDGGTETGNPDTGVTRSVSGTLSGDTSASESKSFHPLELDESDDTGCGADSVLAFSGRGIGTTALVRSDCSFALTLPTDEAYMMVFVRNFQLVAVMAFDNRATAFSAPVGIVSAASSAVALGTVTLQDAVATASARLAEQNDQDSDGVSDYLDDDDDNDGTGDDDESDCDLNGIPDAFESDAGACESAEPAHAPLVEVQPRADRTRDSERRFARRSERIAARFGCAIDTASITAATFAVRDSQGTALTCDYVTSNHDRQVECRHDNVPLTAGETYTATIQNLLCEDGRTARSQTWSWRTRGE